MNNFVIGLKKFFTNKNVVTVILVIVILIVLYWGYTSSIKRETSPVNMPTAAQKINPKTEITGEDVVYKQIPGSMISENALRASNAIIGKYTNINVTIPEGSLFYSEWLVDEKDVPGNWIEKLDVKNGEYGYYMDVTVESTLGNNVLPDSYVDIYMKATDENGAILFGKLMKNIKVLAVHDSNGDDVFGDTDEVLTPAKIGFAARQDMYILLKKTEYLNNVELILAPRGTTVPTENYIIVTSATLRDYIDALTTTIEEDAIQEEIDDNTTDTTDNTTTTDDKTVTPNQ